MPDVLRAEHAIQSPRRDPADPAPGPVPRLLDRVRAAPPDEAIGERRIGSADEGAERRCWLRAAALALPPFRPPRRPRATAAARPCPRTAPWQHTGSLPTRAPDCKLLARAAQSLIALARVRRSAALHAGEQVRAQGGSREAARQVVERAVYALD